MSDMYSLGGGGNAGVPAMTRSQPVRALNTTFQVSASRPTLVMYQVRITNGAAIDGARVDLLSDTGAPPTTVLARLRFGPNTGSTGVFIGTLTAIIFPGHNVRLATTVEGGAPVVAIDASTETIL